MAKLELFKTCKAPVKSPSTTDQQSSFYRLAVLSVAQPTASKQQRRNSVALENNHLSNHRRPLYDRDKVSA